MVSFVLFLNRVMVLLGDVKLHIFLKEQTVSLLVLELKTPQIYLGLVMIHQPLLAAICNSLELNEYTDWFLPSKDELNELYENKDAVDHTAVANGGDLLQNVNYWTSSYFNSDSVWIQTFASGGGSA